MPSFDIVSEVDLQEARNAVDNASGIEGSSLDVPENIVHSGKTWFVEAKLKQGIESATQKKIVKMIKDSKLKVQAQIQGDEIRVTGKSRDDLQAVMAMVRGGDLGQPFQFKNFRD